MIIHVDLYGYGWNYPWCHQTWQGSENPGVFLGFDRKPSINVGFPVAMLEHWRARAGIFQHTIPISWQLLSGKLTVCKLEIMIFKSYIIDDLGYHYFRKAP